MPIPLLSKILPRANIANPTGAVSTVLRMGLDSKTSKVMDKIQHHIVGDKVLDIGVGAGGISQSLRDNGFLVEGVDVKDLTYFREHPPILYDGENIPFEDNRFDTAIIIHVLHHCKDGVKVLDEAKRVANRVIVIEDTYRNGMEKILISLNDMLGNLEFYPHTYRKKTWWKNHIEEKGWELVHFSEWSDLIYNVLYGRYVMFVIE